MSRRREVIESVLDSIYGTGTSYLAEGIDKDWGKMQERAEKYETPFVDELRVKIWMSFSGGGVAEHAAKAVLAAVSEMEAPPTVVTFLARVGDSEVLNELVSVEVAGVLVPLPEEHAPGAVGAVGVNIPAALRAAADKLEKS